MQPFCHTLKEKVTESLSTWSSIKPIEPYWPVGTLKQAMASSPSVRMHLSLTFTELPHIIFTK